MSDTPMPTERRIQAIRNLRQDFESRKAQIMRDLIEDPQITFDLLVALDKVAQSVSYENYGLPLNDPGSIARLRETVVKWAYEALK